MGEIEVLALPIAAAEAMDDEELRATFTDIVVDLIGSFGDDAFPDTFPRKPRAMSRDEILAAVREHQYWFDPDGGHSPPSD